MVQQVSQQEGGKRKSHSRKSTKKGGSDAITGLGTAALLFGARQAYENFLSSPGRRSARSPSPSRRRSGRRIVGGMANIEDVAQDQVQKSMSENFGVVDTAAKTMNNVMNTMVQSTPEGFAPSDGMMSIQDNTVQKGGRKHKKTSKKGGSSEQKQDGGRKRGKGKRRGGGVDGNGNEIPGDSTSIPEENKPLVEPPAGQAGGRRGRKGKKSGGNNQEEEQKGGKKGKKKVTVTYGGALQMYSNQLSQLAQEINKMIEQPKV